MYPSFEIYITLILMPIEILCHATVTKTGINTNSKPCANTKNYQNEINRVKKVGEL